MAEEKKIKENLVFDKKGVSLTEEDLASYINMTKYKDEFENNKDASDKERQKNEEGKLKHLEELKEKGINVEALDALNDEKNQTPEADLFREILKEKENKMNPSKSGKEPIEEENENENEDEEEVIPFDKNNQEESSNPKDEEELEPDEAVITEYEPFDKGKFLDEDTEDMLKRNQDNITSAMKSIYGEDADLTGRITKDGKNRFVEAKLDAGKVRFHGNLAEYRVPRAKRKDQEALKKDMAILVEKYKKDGMNVLHINGKEEFRKLFREVCDEKGMKWVDKNYEDDNKRIEKDLVSRYGKDEESKEEVLKELDEKYGVIANENDVEKAGGAEKFFEQYRGEYLNMADAKQKFDQAKEEDLVINTDGNQTSVSDENVETNAPEEEKPVVETKLNSLENADDKKIVFANDEIELTQKDLLMFDNLEKTRQTFDKFSDVSKEARDKAVSDVLEAYNALNEKMSVKALDDLNDKDNNSDEAKLFRETLEKEVSGKVSKEKAPKAKKKLFENIAKKFSEKAEQFKASKKETVEVQMEVKDKETPEVENVEPKPEVKENPVAEGENKETTTKEDSKSQSEVKENETPVVENKEEIKKKNLFNKAFDKFKRQGR